MDKAIWFETDKILVGGEWRAAASGKTIDLFNPSDGALLARIAHGGAEDIDAAVQASQAARAGAWGKLTAAERGRLMMKLAGLILERVEPLARMEALDVGKPLKQARADAVAMARYFEFYAGAADKVMGETIPYLDGYTVYTIREPHGVTGHIVPWNYPMQILARSVAAALAMGNACVIKPAEEACLTSLAMARLADEAGFPAGAINIVTGLGPEAGAALTAHPGVNHISFTGSVGVGVMVQQAAARNLVPVTLELGGKSPQLVFADADLERALPFLVNGGIQNAGQTCSCAARILVERSRYDEVVARMAARYDALKVGPAIDDPDVGPVISARQKALVERMLAPGRRSDRSRSGEARRRPPGGRLLCRAAPVRRRQAEPSARPAGDFRPGAGRHPLRQRG